VMPWTALNRREQAGYPHRQQDADQAGNYPREESASCSLEGLPMFSIRVIDGQKKNLALSSPLMVLAH
jgi:hypothetical protein